MPKRGWLFKKILSYTLQHSDAYSANTPYLMEQMKRYCLPDKPFALSHLGITPIEASKKEDIVFSNRLHKPLYRIKDIIRAFANFVSMSEYKDWRLVIAAEGNENKLKELAKSLGIVEKVEFVGWLSSEENAKYYAKSRIFISIPQSDSMPTSLLEAMSAGCLPIIADLPSYRGLVENGRNAFVVSDDMIQKADYINKALQLDIETLARNNKQFTDDYATIESNKQRLWDLVDTLCK
jgi:glycosyltransferase involved in cell wall biosynthesis